MEYNRIIAVTGMPGLFEMLSSKTDGAIVRSLDDKTSKFVSSRVHNFSHLESIEIYTKRDNVNLVDIFNAMEKSSVTQPDGKDAAQVKAYFQEVYPDMDFERVYASDMKKMLKWFEVLKKNEVAIKLSEGTEEPVEEESPVVEELTEEPAAKPAKKKAAPKKTDASADTEVSAKETTATAEAEVEKPKKKSAPKKKSEE